MAAPISGLWLPVILGGIWATGSRGAILAVLIAVLPGRWRLAALPLLLLPLLSNQRKDLARVEVWKTAWVGFKQNPWLGHGPNTFARTFYHNKTKKVVELMGTGYEQHHAHNDFLEALCSTGIIGLLAYLILIWPLRHNPSLVALFVVAKFNPIGFEVMCAAALVAANELRKPVTVQKKEGADRVFKPSPPAFSVV